MVQVDDDSVVAGQIGGWRKHTNATQARVERRVIQHDARLKLLGQLSLTRNAPGIAEQLAKTY